MSKKILPRETPSRENRYMGLALFFTFFSKDPSTNMGAVIIDEEKNEILGEGYNGVPSVFDDDDIPWTRPQKYGFIRHAEENAIKHAIKRGKCVEGATMYVTGFPCKDCMLSLAEEKIGKVVYFPYVSSDSSSSFVTIPTDEITKSILDKTNHKLEIVEFSGNLNWIRDRIEECALLGFFN